MAGRGRGERCSRTGPRVCGDVRLGGWRVSCGRAPSGWEWNRSQPCHATELGFPRPALWQMQGEAACRAGEPSGSPKGLGGRDLLAQTDPRRPAGQVVGHHLYRQPSAVGGEAAGRHVVQTDAVLEVSNGVLDSAWRRWSASSSRVSPSRSVMKPCCRWRRGPVGNRAWASPAGR